MTKTTRFTCLVLAVLGVAVPAGLAAAVAKAWWAEESTGADMREMALSASDFPEGWASLRFGPYALPPQDDLRGEAEALMVLWETSAGPPLTGEDVLRYPNELQATYYFHAVDDFREGMFQVSPWGVPEGWTYRSARADRQKFACAQFDDVLGRHTTCVAVAQYGQYISQFTTHLSPTHMTLADLERILAAIDRRMGRATGRLDPEGNE